MYTYLYMERFVFEGGGNKHTERVAEEARNDEHHNSDLFDQDEDGAGEKVDLATGKKIDNSTYTGKEDLRDITDEELTADTKEADLDELAKLISGNAEAEQWLKENRHKL